MLCQSGIVPQHLHHGVIVSLGRFDHPELGRLVDGVDGSGVVASIVTDGGRRSSFRSAGVPPLDGRGDGGRLAGAGGGFRGLGHSRGSSDINLNQKKKKRR